ncbi:alcohol dehydrogenase catalytic domain-containing protein [Pseudonocardia nematodicida]|uniref:Alcohol dehydrogenase catalytic domain-containing protein n=1 Tax=Pseudonocardia nematodicida TaxID=1206997 RepID=A0ABV1KI18_9PSEU
MTAALVRRVRVDRAGAVTVSREPEPVPGAGEALVRSVLVGICGTDVHASAGAHPFIDLPYAPGHEAVGVVGALGPGVTSVTPGDRVVLEPNLACGTCRRCREGRYNICAELRVFGCQTEGAMADAFTVAADRLHVLPDDVSDRAAALVEPLATPVHAVRAAGVGPGDRVVVLGAGPIGLLSAVAARAAGAATVLVTDIEPAKLERAVALGADAGLVADDPRFLARAVAAMGGPADVVVDCVSGESSMRQAVDLLEKGGTVAVVGVPPGDRRIPLHLVQDREVTVRGCLMYTRDDVVAALELVRGLDPDLLITRVEPLDRAAAAFDAARDPDQVKVLVSAVG